MAAATSLDEAQSAALLRAAARQLIWGLRAASEEMRAWRSLAETIPSVPLRRDALHALDCKRGHTDGAALFWTLTARRDRRLLRIVVAYEIIYDYLDNVSERGADRGVANGRQLFAALADALRPGAGHADYYRHNPWRDDGGYLRALVDVCRSGCRELPGLAVVLPYLAREAANVSVFALNHALPAADRDRLLRDWAAVEFRDHDDVHWYEVTAAASQSTLVFALLALATDGNATPGQARATYDAYFPWFGNAVTMLDSYVDQAEDARRGAHSYVAHYPSPEVAVERVCLSVERAAERLLALPNGERHAVLLASMVAMYLSKDSARSPELRAGTAEIVRAGGSLTRLLLPVLRAWRICNGQATKT